MQTSLCPILAAALALSATGWAADPAADVTADLSPVGRLIIICTMFLGRVGPLAVLASLIGGGGAAAGTYRLPRDNVSLG